MSDPMPVILDTDPGIDDAVALALAARSAETDLVGVTTSYGNHDLNRTSRNARHVLGLAGAGHIPVHPGADRPLRRPPIPRGERHGPEGVGSASVDPAPRAAPNPVALLDLIRASRRAATVVMLGPPTNLAHALEADGELVRRKVGGVVAMLGNLGTPVAVDRHADFNAWCDPEAVEVLLRSGLPLALVPLDAAERVTLEHEEVAAWQRAPDPLAQWLGAAVGWRIKAGEGGPVSLPDVVAVAAVLDTRSVTLAERRLSVDLDEGPTRGHTRERDNGTEVEVATEVAVPRVRRLLARIGRTGEAAGTDEETR